MKKSLITCTVVLAAAAFLVYGLIQVGGKEWSGVDETVVEKYAKEAGHPARSAVIDTDRGDLLLFFFLIAGAGGGFLAGYSAREMFGPDARPVSSQPGK